MIESSGVTGSVFTLFVASTCGALLPQIRTEFVVSFPTDAACGVARYVTLIVSASVRSFPVSIVNPSFASFNVILTSFVMSLPLNVTWKEPSLIRKLSFWSNWSLMITFSAVTFSRLCLAVIVYCASSPK